MEAIFVEQYQKLCNMQPGDIAISKDRKKFFICGHQFNKDKNVNEKVILDLNNLWEQYSDKWDYEQPILILKNGDKFVVTR